MKRFIYVIAALTLSGCSIPILNAASNNADLPEKPPATVAVTRGSVEQTVTAPGQLVNTREAVLSMDVGGRLSELNVRPGDSVKKGQKIAAVDASELREKEQQARADHLIAQAEYSQTVKGPSAAAVSAARAELAGAQANYSDLQKPPSDNEVANLRALMQNAEAALKRAQAAYDSEFARNPAGIGASGASLELEKATNDYNAAKANYDKAFEKPSDGEMRGAAAQIAAARLKLASLQPVAEEIGAAKARLDKAYLVWQQARSDLEHAVLTALMDGIVLEVKAREGETITAGSAIIVMADPKSVEVQASVIEEDLPLVRIGQEVSIFFDAAPDMPVTGKVARIAPKRLEGDRPLYATYIEVSDLPDGLAPGMSVDASVIIAKVEDALRLPRALVKAGSGGTATVEVWTNGQREKRSVKVGLRGDTYVEIVEGLQAGEEVVGE